MVAFVADPGERLLIKAVEPYRPDAHVSVHWTPVSDLRRPTVQIDSVQRFPLVAPEKIGLRAAPAVFGLGLLEAIPAGDIVAAANACQFCPLGIRGRPRWVRDSVTGRAALGRFGWKAGQASVKTVVVEALARDIGIISKDFADAAALQPEIDAREVNALAFYMRTRGVPARSIGNAEQLRRGARVFDSAHCAACHTPVWVTGGDHEIPHLRGQTIHPYSDLLLHDMGEGLAAADRATTVAPREWRTPPLWGIGLQERVSGQSAYLHDGRARSIEEAILWHGGEAKASLEAFVGLSGEARRDLVAFLQSL